MKTDRRNFLRIAGVSGAAVIAGDLKSFNLFENGIKLLSPVDGDMLNEFDGKAENGSLITPVKVQAPSGTKIRINGIDAKYADNMFIAYVPLKDYKNILEVNDVTTGSRQSITVFWLKNYANRYRLSLDDNIWFLRDISNNSATYKSIFENPYLAFFKQIHDTYGTKVHINIYYQTEGFNLSQMTTKYKSEWKDNAELAEAELSCFAE